MLLIFLNNKYRVIVAFILFSVSLLTKYFPAYYFIPFLTTSSALFFLLLYFLKQIVKEINTTAYLRLFLVVQALQTICNILRVYFYYEHPALFINCSTYFLAFTSLSILLNIYFGYNKKVFIAGRKMESVPVVSLDKEEEFLKDLKDREIEVLYYLSQGLDEQEAAEKMALGIKSIYNYIAILKEKLDLKHIMAISHFAAVNREKIAKRHNCIKKQ
jgi:DNA-binding CsgD family transcriptional regulator